MSNTPTPETDAALNQCNQNSSEVGILDLAILLDHARKLERQRVALLVALERQMSWVNSALKCPSWHWDGDQREAAEIEYDEARQAIAAVKGEQG